ncbi:MAG: 4-(cytidine 5'-diphospho)-2-C-methyl-D-erythritol kinase [Alphaproteobacteria bacterium]|nr:4-(cytidine 5'-diphospho)-2-C-methyl-D-erythritol kinase [Alphaproteobacteria bacterium]
MSGPPIRRFAPAKINLSLKVLGRRADGYHLLDSLVAFADIGDWVTAAPSDRLTLEIVGPQAAGLVGADPSDNLVLRAAAALRRLAGVEAGAALTLEKRLPVASGIGGGSADAAAALRALTALWGIDPPAERLAALALDLGADVPVCLTGRPARMTGIGGRLETVAPLPSDPPAGLVLLNPGVATPTGAVFAALAGRFSAAPDAPAALGPTAADLATALKPLGNDLTAPAIATTPVIAETLAALDAAPAARYAALSGSGATCFALFDDRAAAAAAADALAAAHPGWWVAAGVLSPDGGAAP